MSRNLGSLQYLTMAIITINRKQFEKEIGKLDEKMQNKIAMFGTTVEKFNDKEIEIEVFPNRPDMLSYQGFKRSFLAFLLISFYFTKSLVMDRKTFSPLRFI